MHRLTEFSLRRPWLTLAVLHVITGVLAVVVASPCTAPFMGSALGFALTQPAIASLTVFVALALGLIVDLIVTRVSSARDTPPPDTAGPSV